MYYIHMKINIWVHKTDIVDGKITKFYNICPQNTDWINWYQVEIDQDTFIQLLDNKDNSDWLIDQYNRNRDTSEHISDISNIQDDYDNQPFGD